MKLCLYIFDDYSVILTTCMIRIYVVDLDSNTDIYSYYHHNMILFSNDSD
jgi:hypothetical protein